MSDQGAPAPHRRPIAETLRLLAQARACPHRTPGRTGCEWGTCGVGADSPRRIAPADCFACLDGEPQIKDA